MAHTAISDPEYMEEVHEDEESVTAKVKQLAKWIREARRVCIFTGAGISTDAGIGDFRGPQGKWTLEARGEKRTAPTVCTTKAVPTSTHMAIVALQRARPDDVYVISQNCDGLHRRSGLPPEAISELHGNSNIEYCIKCGRKYLRDFACFRITRSSDHYTGRHCDVPGCGGRLWDSTIDFGQNLPQRPLELAYEHSRAADVHLVLGSSLTVSPACDMPVQTRKSGGRLVICNLQKTPLYGKAHLNIRHRCDRVMRGLMAELGIDIPEWRLRRRFRIEPAIPERRIRVRGIDADDAALPAAVFRHVTLELNDKAQKVDGLVKAKDTERKDAYLPHAVSSTFDFSLAGELPREARLTLSFMGHYKEPDVALDLPMPGVLMRDTECELSYDPLTREWQASSVACGADVEGTKEAERQKTGGR